MEHACLVALSDLPLLFFNYISSIAFVTALPLSSKSGYILLHKGRKYRCWNTVLIFIKFNTDVFGPTHATQQFLLIPRARASVTRSPGRLLRAGEGKGKKERRGRRTAAWSGDYNPGNQNRPFLAVNYNARTLLNLSIMIDNLYNLRDIGYR